MRYLGYQHGLVLNGVGQETIETAHRIARSFENLEQPIGPRKLKDDRRLRRNSCQLELAVALHDLGHAVQQHVHAGGIHLSDQRTIKHKLGPIGVEEWLYVAKEHARLFLVESVWHALHDNGPTRFHISSQ